MDNTPQFARLFWRTSIALATGAALVACCYFFVDRPVAFFVHEHRFSQYAILKWITFVPPTVQAWAPLVLAALMIRRVWGPFCRCELTLLAAAVGIVLADQFKESLAYVFGRYWPETWVDDNPSLIKNGAYGFHLFHGGTAYGSFPSGHTARTVAVAAALWIGYPLLRPLSIALSLTIAVALLGMNYHFVGDVIAGGFIGGIVGAYTARGCGLALTPPRDP